MSELSVPLRPAYLKEGHPSLSSSSSPFCLFLFLSFSPFSFLSPPLASSSSTPTPAERSSGWFGGWWANLDIQIRDCQLRGLLSPVACPGSFFPLSPSSCGHRRPYKAAFLLVHFSQFQQCHSNRCSGEWREAELAVSLTARTVLFGPTLDGVPTATKLLFIEVFVSATSTRIQ